MGFHANTFNRSLLWISLYSSFRQCHMKTKCNSLAELLAQWEKISNQPRMLATSRSPLLPIHLLNSSTTVSVSLLYWLFCRKLRTPSMAHLFSTSKSPQLIIAAPFLTIIRRPLYHA